MDKKMNMLLVIQTLQLRGRAGAREIASRCGMTNEESISALMELDKRGKVKQANGFWWLHVELEPQPAKISKRKR